VADNVNISAGSGTAIAADDVSSVYYQRVKPAWGVDGAAVDTSGTDPLPVSIRPIGTSGCTPYHLVGAASTNATSVKGSAGQIYGIVAVNTNTSARYLKLYNKASAPTVGSDTPVLTLPLPGGGGVAFPIAQGIAFATGIAIALTTGAADNDTGAVAAAEQIVNLLYV
jgi:hypothetical protein